MAEVLHTDPPDVYARLHELQLREEQLTGAIAAGLAAKASCTSNHPATFPGLAMWAEAVRYLRDILSPAGWSSIDSRGLPLVIRGDRELAIGIASGDEDTGSADGSPSTRHSKGVATLEFVERNGVLPFENLPPELERDGAISTWFLLHYRKGNEIVCELSHPVSMNDSGYINEWDERIILTAIPLDPAHMPVVDAPPVESEVVIRRREA